tara:strand:- start:13199 stop:13510 length:312 start_codon:yes stop_codon:yes gene_type:complete
LAARAFSRLFKTLLVLVLLVAGATAATWMRYESFDPCAWMQQEMVEESGLPELIVIARIKAAFLLDGVTEPTPKQCLYAWWKHRFEGAKVSAENGADKGDPKK